MQLQNRQILQLNMFLQELLTERYQLKSEFAYAAAYNKNLLTPYIEAINAVSSGNKKVKDYDEQRMQILRNFAKLDEKGNFIVASNNGAECIIPEETIPLFEKEIENLKSKFEFIDAEIKNQYTITEEMLNKFEEVEKLKLINYKSLPDSLPGNFMIALMPIISDGE